MPGLHRQVAMNSGTQAVKEVGDIVALDSDAAKLVKFVEIGKQLLMSGGARTTLSMLVWRLDGVIVPFIGIKLIGVVFVAAHLVS